MLFNIVDAQPARLSPCRETMLAHLEWVVAPARETHPGLRLEVAWVSPTWGRAEPRHSSSTR